MIGDKLRQLRQEHDLTLEALSLETGISRAALSKYETEENKSISHKNLMILAKYYNVSADFLLDLTNHIRPRNTQLDELGLNDEVIDLLKQRRLNHSMLCALITHPKFPELLDGIQSYADGTAQKQIDAINRQLSTAVEGSADSRFAKLVDVAAVNDETFLRVLHEELDEIVRAQKFIKMK